MHAYLLRFQHIDPNSTTGICELDKLGYLDRNDNRDSTTFDEFGPSSRMAIQISWECFRNCHRSATPGNDGTDSVAPVGNGVVIETEKACGGYPLGSLDQDNAQWSLTFCLIHAP